MAQNSTRPAPYRIDRRAPYSASIGVRLEGHLVHGLTTARRPTRPKEDKNDQTGGNHDHRAAGDEPGPGCSPAGVAGVEVLTAGRTGGPLGTSPADDDGCSTGQARERPWSRRLPSFVERYAYEDKGGHDNQREGDHAEADVRVHYPGTVQRGMSAQVILNLSG